MEPAGSKAIFLLVIPGAAQREATHSLWEGRAAENSALAPFYHFRSQRCRNLLHSTILSRGALLGNLLQESVQIPSSSCSLWLHRHARLTMAPLGLSRGGGSTIACS